MRLYVPLNRQEYEALERLAFAERRRPRDQAAAMLATLLDADACPDTGCTPNDLELEIAPNNPTADRESDRVPA
jgi:hypothetical protein